MRNNINSLLLPSLYLIRDMLLHACSLVGLTSQHATSFQLHVTLWKSSESSAIMCVCVFACVSMCMCACRSVCDRVWLLHVASLITRELMSFMSFHMTLLDTFGRLWTPLVWFRRCAVSNRGASASCWSWRPASPVQPVSCTSWPPRSPSPPWEPQRDPAVEAMIQDRNRLKTSEDFELFF